jgi:hypothetical protein
MVAAPRGSDLALPRQLLAFGAVLLFLAGAVQVLLYFLAPGLGSLSLASSLGLGGGLAAIRLWRLRTSRLSLPPDGA